jgi:phosphate transport system permease protein
VVQADMTSGGPKQRTIVVARTPADRLYRRIAQTGGLLTFILLFLIGVFLFIEALPALRVQGVGRFLVQFEWGTDADVGVGAVLFGTVVIALIALVIAVPLAILTSLFITDWAPPWLRGPLTSVVDLMAAVPSIIYGLWGFFFLQPRLLGLSHWLGSYLGFIPIFKTNTTNIAGSPFIAGVVVALMVVPIASSVMREVFSRTPPSEKEGALALGGTRWGMVRTVVLPFGRGGIIGGSMLGLGRALGETIAIAIIINSAFRVSPRILESGGNTIASLIALRFGEATELGRSGLVAAGLVLFIMTLLVNLIASSIVSRTRSGAGVEI